MAGSGEPVVASLVVPELIFIDPDAIETSGNACLEAEIATGSVQIRPVVTDLWADDNLAVDIVVDLEFDPDVLRWTFAGGSSVVAVIVGDQGLPEVAANLFDYREFAGAVAGDAGLNAPSGDPGFAFVCYDVEPESEPPGGPGRVAMPMKRQASATGQPPAIPTTPAAGTTRSDEVSVAAIGVSGMVRNPVRLNLRTAPSTSGDVIGVLPVGTLSSVIGGPQSASGSPGGSCRPRWARDGPRANSWKRLYLGLRHRRPQPARQRRLHPAGSG